MNRARLETLADYLSGTGKFVGKGVPKEKFHLSVFMASYQATTSVLFRDGYSKTAASRRFTAKASDPKANQAPLKVIGNAKRQHRDCNVEIVKPVYCQTAGCACGWATTIPAFRKAGLCLINSDSSPGRVANLALVEADAVVATGFDAAARFFDVGLWDAYNLFDPEQYIVAQRSDPTFVARRIRALIKNTAAAEEAHEAAELLS